MRSMPKLHMKHCFISQSHTLLTCFVFSWVVEVSAACFVGCLAHVPWWQRGLGAGSLLASFFTVLLFCIDDSVISVVLICITAHAQCSFTSYCFSAQCCSITAYHIAMICRCAFFTSTFLNSEGFQHVDLSCSCSQQLGLLTELISGTCMVVPQGGSSRGMMDKLMKITVVV